MAIRNFWIEADIDGRATNLAGGPRAKDGGFNLVIYQRSEGAIIKAATISGFAHEDGTLRLHIDLHEGKTIDRTTKR